MPTAVAPATERSVVLLGAGHTHLHVLRHWAAQAPTRTMLTCVSNFDAATYSGMLTGVLAGEYATSAMEIPLAALCAAAGATLIVDETRTVDIAARRLTLSDDRVVPFDVLSVGVGSVPRADSVTIVGERGLVQV